MSDKALSQLFTEYADWYGYGNFVKHNARVPKSVSGLLADEKRFVFFLDVLADMKFDHMQRQKFIKVILEQEKAAANPVSEHLGKIIFGSSQKTSTWFLSLFPHARSPYRKCDSLKAQLVTS